MITKYFVKYILLLLIIIILNNININTIYDEVLREKYLNCPIDYNDNLQQLIQKSNNNPLRGYTKNDYLYKMEKMENIKMNDPLPINSKFFYNQY